MSSIITVVPIFRPPEAAPAEPQHPSSFKADVQQLGQDLQAGNLSQAQADFVTLSQEGPLANANLNSPRIQNLRAVGTALQAGDLAGAQKSFAAFQKLLSQGRAPLQRGIQELAQDLQAGNLNLAQADFKALPIKGPSANPNSTNPLVQDLLAVGTALKAGDLAGAQNAFATFQQAFQQRLSQAGGDNGHQQGGPTPASAGPDGNSVVSARLNVTA